MIDFDKMARKETLAQSLVCRTTTTEMLVSIVNCLDLSQGERAKLQECVNRISGETQKMYDELQELIAEDKQV